MPVTDSTNSMAERANELYWNSARTVEEIVRELKMSRSALYAAIRPQDAATTCPECGDAMVFTNRSNRDARAATCASCGAEAPAAEANGGEGSAPRASSHDRSAGSGGRPWTSWRIDLAAAPRERVAMVGGAAVLGVMVGAFAARIVREMI